MTDKTELVLDMIEHPEKYTPERLEELLSDGETREIYTLLCKTDAAVKTPAPPDVDAEWSAFSAKHLRPLRRLRRQGSRAAVIAAVVGTSVVAIGAGIAVTVAVRGDKSAPSAEQVTVVADGVGRPSSAAAAVEGDSIVAGGSGARIDMAPVMFEDEPLEKILKSVADVYGTRTEFRNRDAAALHLYYRFDPSLPLTDIVDQLNTFEQINISLNDNVLIIE